MATRTDPEMVHITRLRQPRIGRIGNRTVCHPGRARSEASAFASSHHQWQGGQATGIMAM